MKSSDLNTKFHQCTTMLDDCHPVDWHDIVALLCQIKRRNEAPLPSDREDYLRFFGQGVAFITFSYGIDGVSIETAKYAQALSDLFSPYGKPSIHLIGGNFHPQASSILKPEWHRFQIDGIDGWNKWDHGKWFDALFGKKMESFGRRSDQLAGEIYKQAVLIAKQLGDYFLSNHISLIIPVNVASNPGNIALTLALVLVSEILGICVLNSNHDFYWEAGKPISEREPGELPGVRDHFFRNIKNRSFFRLFKLLYPWNGERWLQMNINARQSRKLIEKFNFPGEKVGEISTCISDAFFDTSTENEVTNIRLKMAHILSDGEAVMRPVPIDKHLTEINQWMKNQQPVIVGSEPGLSIDPSSADLIILLQPTRIVGRKRISRDLDLIGALFQKSALRDEFAQNANRQLILHITGPTPKEHQKDLEQVLFAYKKRICTLPAFLATRIFLAFSVGWGSHPASFAKNSFTPLTIENIYRMADVVVFPSKTEGRGLPIIEAGASGIPIICARYRPQAVFSDVIGESLPEKSRIQYTLFPKGEFSQPFLSIVSNLLICSGFQQKLNSQNRDAVHTRYSYEAFKINFARLLNQLFILAQGA